jgi:hypothetical protein
MGRGKDGYTSLLIEAEGGTAKEIVSEENGCLISTILRQYFMSLKILGKWKYWGPSMNRKFDKVQSNLQRTHTFVEPTSKPASPVQVRHPQVNKVKAAENTEMSSSSDEDEDEDDGAVYDDSKPILFSEHELSVLRRVMAKWWRLAGLKGSPRCCDVLGAEEFQANWTRAIAPRVEGRIKGINERDP